MTRLTLAKIVAEELATVREFAKGSAVRGRPRRTEWSERLPGFGIRFYSTGRSVYIVQALMNGVTRTVTLGSTKVLSKHEALKVARRVLLRAQVGENPASERIRTRKTPSYADFLDLYWQRASPKWKARTLDTQTHYRRRYLDNAFVGKFVDEIDQADVLAWFNRVTDIGGPGAGNRCFEILRSMLNHAERWGYRPEGSNPCTFIRANKRRKCERFLSDQEVARLGKVLDARRKTDPLRAIIIYMLLLTGCRRSEITELTWGEIKGSRLLLHDSKTGPRTVWLGEEARMLLSTLERRGPADPVFWNKFTKRPVRDIEGFWAEVKAEAGLLGVRLHDLRHSFASHAAARSETLPMIGKLLGHARLQSTSRYAHLDDTPLLDAAERIGNLIAEAMCNDSTLIVTQGVIVRASFMSGKQRTRIYKSRWFAKFAIRAGISDATLVAAIDQAEQGLIDADLGGGLIKQRVARQGEGKSGGYRTLVFFRHEDRAVFAFGFAKSGKANLNAIELRTYKRAAGIMLGLTQAQIDTEVREGRLFEVNDDAKTYKSEALAAVHEMKEGLHEAGTIDKQTLREFDEACLAPAVPLAAEEIKAIREAQHVSQPVFARYLNVSKNLVSDWERGKKRPGGPALRLLSIIQRKGLDAVA